MKKKLPIRWDRKAKDNLDEIYEKIAEDHKKILDERLAAHENNPEDVVSWEEVKKSVKKIL